MRIDDMVIVSVDDHVIEPPHLFDSHLPARFRDAAPRIRKAQSGADVWVYEGRELPLGHVGEHVGFKEGATVVVGENGQAPISFDDIRPGCWDIHERIKDMDVNGQMTAMCFPQFPRFSGQVFSEATDKDIAYVMLQAYNDWHVEEWAGSYPGRMIPLGILPMWDAELVAKEVRRLAGKGCHAVTFTVSPFRLGLPSLHTDFWDPMWAACADVSTVVCMHLGSDSHPLLASPDAPHNVQTTLAPMSTIYGAVDLIWSHVFRTYPVKVALSEGGIGWIPWLLERIDHSLTAHSFTKQNFAGKKPSDVFREHIITCFIDDPHGVKARHEIGVESICVEVDYPHSDSTWPNSPELMLKDFVGVPDDEIDQMTHLNAMHHFQFDPFVEWAREECTVGALRARASVASDRVGAR
jgi:predicted TIM-barrel fold metal-dependent hydrolase